MTLRLVYLVALAGCSTQSGRVVHGDIGESSEARLRPHGDRDGDGWQNWEDCRPKIDRFFPGGPEECNGRDDDCDGLIDNDAVDAPTWYPDIDGDGWGQTKIDSTTYHSDGSIEYNSAAPNIESCDQPADIYAYGRTVSYVANGEDCANWHQYAHPDMVDSNCNDFDDDCDRSIDEDDLVVTINAGSGSCWFDGVEYASGTYSLQLDCGLWYWIGCNTSDADIAVDFDLHHYALLTPTDLPSAWTEGVAYYLSRD
jgi:hypothetical protein